MVAEEKYLDAIRADVRSVEKGKSKLISPAPTVKKFITELLLAFGNREISLADLIRLDQKKIQQVAEMGFVKLKHGRYDEARHIFEVLTFIDHKNYFHRLALAATYQKIKKNLDALFQYGEVLKLDSNNINALVNRGEIYLRNKNYRKAAEDFREAILLDRAGKDLFANRARSLVIAIKRSLEKDKQLKAAGGHGELPKRKGISPLALARPVKK